MTMEEFWSGITLYMDELHSIELFLVEELENCEGSYEDLDLLALGGAQLTETALSNGAPQIATLSFDGASSESILDAVGKMSQEETKNALMSFLTQSHNKSQTSASSNPSKRKNSISSQPSSPAKFRDSERPPLEEWEISLYDVEFHKRSKYQPLVV